MSTNEGYVPELVDLKVEAANKIAALDADIRHERWDRAEGMLFSLLDTLRAIRQIS